MPGKESPSQLRPSGQLDLGVLKQMYGDLIFQIVALQSENNDLRKQVIELGRKIPPEDPPKELNDPKSDTS